MAGQASIGDSIHRNSRRRLPLIGRERRPVIAIAAANNREIGQSALGAWSLMQKSTRCLRLFLPLSE
jgi:hypothetical protein